MLPSAAELYYFLEVAQTLNISRAAERLGITQPSLSLAIHRLEDNLKAQLLIRSKTGVHLTSEGHRFQAHARQLLNEWEKIKSETLKQNTEIRGHYTIGCHPSVALYTLHLFMPELMQKNPGLEIHFKHDLSRKITEDVISYKLDFGIVVNPVQHPDLVIKELIHDKVTFWVNKSLASQITDESCLICDPELIQSQALLKKLKKLKINFKRMIHSPNLEVVTQLTEAGCGVGIIPTRVVEKSKGNHLVHYHKQAPTFEDVICLVYRSDSPKTAAHKLIVDLIKENII